MALVVTLALLLLLSILVMAFFSQATLNRQISFASAAQARADNVSETALQTIVGDLRDEMAAGSVVTVGTTGGPVYMPTTNLTMLPQRVGTTGLTNLFKISAGGSNSWSGSSYRYAGPIRAISGNSTTNASANGRYIPLSVWLEPQLLTTAETNSLRAPDWVLVTRGGPLTNASALTMADFSSKNATNTNYVIGRYAYAVYEVGGLLDANVSGYPSTAAISATDLARKGSLALVSLTNLPNLSAAKSDALVNWRLPASNYASTNYVDYIRTVLATNGFLRPPPGANAFFSRQDLIQFAKTNGLSDDLPFLTSFSRERNSPSWSPATPANSSIDYAALANTAGSTNRNLANVRDSSGLALIKSRFDLNRLAWLTYKGPSASLATTDPLYNSNGTPANIQKYFGLVWDSSTFDPSTEHGEQWVYVSPEGSGVVPADIKTLDQVGGREPDFFELLKAGILSGSTGLSSAGEGTSYSNKWLAGGNSANLNALNYRLDAADGNGRMFNEVPDYQIFAIGANILGQYSADSYPPFIQTPGGNVIGVESLPFESAHGLDAYRPIATFEGDTNRDNVYFWLKFVVWNPYRNAAITSTNAGPTNFRIHPVKGIIQGTFQDMFVGSADKTLAQIGSPVPNARDFSADTNVAVVFSSSNNNFIDPTPLTYGNTVSVTDNGAFSAYGRLTAGVAGKDIAGIFVSKVKAPDWMVHSGLTTNTYSIHPELYYIEPRVTGITTPVILDLRTQYQDAQGRWRSYQLAPNNFWPSRALDDNTSPKGPVSEPYINTAAFGMTESAYVDPRDRRLGLTHNEAFMSGDPDPDGNTSTFRNGTSSYYRRASVYYYNDTNNLHFSVPKYPGFFSDNYAANNVLTATNYSDPDRVVRGGDGNSLGSIPVALSSVAGRSRPLMLNAPFHAVGDLGYTYRDLLWKSLDFFTTNSADAGLLDLFRIGDGSTNSLPMVAGKININTAPAPVLQAILSDGMVDFGSDLATVGSKLSTSDVSTLVGALRPSGRSAPVFVNKADLVSFFATNLPTSTYKIKGEREAPIRAVADVAQTRVWNLLIDVVAQAGRYAPGASGVNKFIVEGEKHYWLQIAIDRFTGEILDQELEPIYEQ